MGFVTETQLRAMLAKGIPNPFRLEADMKLTPAAADFLKGRGITLLRERSEQPDGREVESKVLPLPLIPVGVSNRHVHLSQQHIELLFGRGHKLTMSRFLLQPQQYAARETLVLKGPKGELRQVRVLGPARQWSQVELSRTDCYTIGIAAPLRLSGELADTPGIEVYGPSGMLRMEQGVIVARRHIHMSIADANRFQVQQGQLVSVQTVNEGHRKLTFSDVVVRIDDVFKLEMHIDTDEANAAGLSTGDQVQLLGTAMDMEGL